MIDVMGRKMCKYNWVRPVRLLNAGKTNGDQNLVSVFNKLILSEKVPIYGVYLMDGEVCII